MNEEQKAFLERMKGQIDSAILANTPDAYEHCVDELSKGIDTCPEP